MLLRGVQFTTPALTQEDIEATRNRSSHTGRGFGGAPFRRGSGRGRGARGDHINYSRDRGDNNSDYRNGNGYHESNSNPFAAHLDPGFIQAAAARGYGPPPPGWVPPPQFGRGAPPPPSMHGPPPSFYDGRQNQGQPPANGAYPSQDRGRGGQGYDRQNYGGRGYGGHNNRGREYGGHDYGRREDNGRDRGGQSYGGQNYASGRREHGGYGNNGQPPYQTYNGGGGYRGGR